MAEELQLADLTPDKIGKLRALESGLGKAYVLAFRRQKGVPPLSKGISLAQLDARQVAQVAAVEAELEGVYLLAFRGA